MGAYFTTRFLIVGDSIDRGDELKTRRLWYNHGESVGEGENKARQGKASQGKASQS